MRLLGGQAGSCGSWNAAPALRVEGYIIDFFGPGCDAAEDTQLALDLIRN